jgi:hypothetical protein
MLHRVSLKTILIAGAILAALLPAVLISAVMVQSLHDSAIQEATARYELPSHDAAPAPRAQDAAASDSARFSRS